MPIKLPHFSKRQNRYNVAEAALVATFERCSTEPSPREIQICILRKATSLLSVRAEEARRRAEKLRVYLADRQMEPEAYTGLQRERWVEERRQSAMTQDFKMLQETLQMLSNREDSARGNDQPGSDLDSKCRANLERFLRSSSTGKRIAFVKNLHLNVPRRRSAFACDLKAGLCLGTSSQFPGKHETGSRTESSLKGLRCRTRDKSHFFSLLLRRSKAGMPFTESLLSHVTEDGNSSSDDLLASSSSVTLTTSSISSDIATGDSSPSIQSSRHIGSLPNDWSIDDGKGTATIYQTPQLLLSKEAIMNDLTIEIPEYAQSLLDEFGVSQPICLLFPQSPLHHTYSHLTVSPTKSKPMLDQRTSLSAVASSANADSRSSTQKSTFWHRKAHQSSFFSIPKAISSRVRSVGDQVGKLALPNRET